MGFADAYLLKAGLRESLIDTDPQPGLKLIITIPVYNESGLERCLDSLFIAGQYLHRTSSQVKEKTPSSNIRNQIETTTERAQQPTPFHTEVLILINASAEAPGAVLEQNRKTLEETRRWIGAHPHPYLDFHLWMDHTFPAKEAGVGLARKILMDEAVRRFSMVDHPGGIIASLDADVVVDPNYMEAVVTHFNKGASGSGKSAGGSTGSSTGNTPPDGCSIYFEHPLGPDESVPLQPDPDENRSNAHGDDAPDDPPHAFETFPPAVYEAITLYELHLRTYLSAVRSTGYPHAFHTVGSSFAVRAGIYCKEGGMNRRQGGEDFYFIQKVAQLGNWSECNTTRVVASPRPSDRVPFGTGPVVERLTGVQSQQPASEPVRLTTYHPEPFRMLEQFFSEIDLLYPKSYPGSTSGSALQLPSPLLSEFLESQNFIQVLEEIRRNSASLPAFRKRFWRWFNMFRIMKFLHFAREHGYPDVDVTEAASELLNLVARNKEPGALLTKYRRFTCPPGTEA